MCTTGPGFTSPAGALAAVRDGLEYLNSVDTAGLPAAVHARVESPEHAVVDLFRIAIEVPVVPGNVHPDPGIYPGLALDAIDQALGLAIDVLRRKACLVEVLQLWRDLPVVASG